MAPAPVTATRTPAGPLLTKTPTIEKREAGCLNFCQPAFSGIGKLTEVMISPSCSAVVYMPLKNWSAGMLRWFVWTVAPSPSTAAG